MKNNTGVAAAIAVVAVIIIGLMAMKIFYRPTPQLTRMPPDQLAKYKQHFAPYPGPATAPKPQP